MAEHRHQAASMTTTPWVSCVAPGKPHDERSHGNVIETQVCRCGAWRHVEVNLHGSVSARWTEPSPARS